MCLLLAVPSVSVLAAENNTPKAETEEAADSGEGAGEAQETDATEEADQQSTKEQSYEEAERAAEEREEEQANEAGNVDSGEDAESDETPPARQESKDSTQESSEKKSTAGEKQGSSAVEQNEEEDEVEVEDDSVEEEPVIEEVPKPTAPIVEEPVKEDTVVQKRVIGATATLMEKKSELLFHARVDSGAKSCSLHIEDLKIENEEEKMADNIGKVVRFQIKNGNGESHWLEAKIAGYVIIKTTDSRERRYKVPLTFRYKDFEKQVLVTLNNRANMEFPLLLGRNFLRDDFVVDVSVDSND